LTERNTDRLFFGGVKFVTDGSVPVLTLKLNWPEYLEGGNGNRGDIEYNQLFSRMLPYWKAGSQLHVHTNGDASIDATLDALQKLQDERPRFNHRFCLEHYVVSNTSQAKRLADLGGCASVNVTYVNTRAQRYKDIVLGPDRAESMGRLASLEAEGVTFGLHSDYALVPLNPLLHIYTAVTRLGLDGETVYGPGEKIGRERALRAVTVDAAYLLEKETTHGSIEQGKVADFAILDEDPMEVEPTKIKDIKIWGTVLGGKKQPYEPLT
jgi:predicted amidohydrolase YtcJ